LPEITAKKMLRTMKMTKGKISENPNPKKMLLIIPGISRLENNQ